MDGKAEYFLDPGLVHLFKQHVELVAHGNVLRPLIFGCEVLEARRAIAIEPHEFVP